MNDESKSKEELFRDPITQQPRVLDDSEVARNFMTCMFICIMQLTMTISTLIYFGKPTSDGPNKNADPLFITYVVRLMCQLALHMLIDPEVFQSIQMIKFALYRCNSFRLRSCHILIALMQLGGALSTEYINMLLICEQDEVKNIVMNFVQFTAIVQIDDWYAQSLKNSFLRKLVQETSLNFQSISKKGFKELELNKQWHSKLMLEVLYKPLKTAYDSFYYYFAPTLVLFISYYRQYNPN